MSDSCIIMDRSPPASSVHGISQARILEGVAISFSRGLPDPGIKPVFPALASRFLNTEPPRKPHYLFYYVIKLSLSISIVVTKIMASCPIT